MRKCVVTGAGGFIGGHLVERLKDEGYYVIGVDIKEPEFRKIRCNDFMLLDLRNLKDARKIFEKHKMIDEVYQLAADMGGMGFIHSHPVDCLTNNVLINLNMLRASTEAKVGRYFYSSSVCMYKAMNPGDPQLTEEDAYPALPDNEYGWEKLYSEILTTNYGKEYKMPVRIARFENCYGPFGTWTGGREKAPAALCRKVASIEGDEGEIEVWGDGSAIRDYVYVEDLVDGIRKLMESDIDTPVNIGTEEYVTVDELADIVAQVAGKRITKNHVLDKPVGVLNRNFSHDKIRSLGWTSKYSLKEGIEITYPWILKQVKQSED